MANKNLQTLRTGEVRQMRNGMKAKIIKYRGWKDIDVQFEDGTIVTGRQYTDFKRGEIANINYRIGETRTMNCGKSATIIRYRNARDIDVQFEGGAIAEHRQYSCFLHGHIRCPK